MNVNDLFDIPDATMAEKAERLEDLKSSFAKSRQTHDRLAKYGLDDQVQAVAKARAEMKKSLDSDQYALVTQALDEAAALSKDITAGAYPAVGSPGNLRPYDLEAPAKILVPRKTPILNTTPRNKGVGGAREYRRILGYTNSGFGGVPDQDVFFNSETVQNTFGGVTGLRRPNKIGYAMDVHTVAYVEAGVSDSVTYKAQFANLGFENSRDLSHMAMLWAHKIGEEKALLFGRGNSSQGYSGPFNGGAAPSAVTGAASGSNGGAFAGSATLQVTYRAGVGESPASTASATISGIVAGNNITTTLVAPPAGAYGTNVYVNIVTSTGTGAVPAVGSYFAGFFPPGTTAITINPNSLVQTATVPGSDTTSSNGYDGLLTVLTNSALSGYVGTSVGSVATNGVQPWQTAFQSLYASVLADPQRVFVESTTRMALGKWLRSASNTSSGYRLELPNAAVDGVKIGAAVVGLTNETTGSMTDLILHPYMPAGCSVIQSTTLDIPDSGIGETSEVISAQEYACFDWAPIQLTYDASTYWYGTFVHYAPAWSGALTGITA